MLVIIAGSKDHTGGSFDGHFEGPGGAHTHHIRKERECVGAPRGAVDKGRIAIERSISNVLRQEVHHGDTESRRN